MSFFIDENLIRAFYGANTEGKGTPFSFFYDGANSRDLSLEWDLKSNERGGGKTTYGLEARIPGSQVYAEAKVTVYESPAAADMTLCFENRGGGDSGILSGIRALDMQVQLPNQDKGAVMHFLRGSSIGPDDWEPYDQLVGVPGAPKLGRYDTPSVYRFGTKNGKPAFGVCPFFNIEWSGGGMICAIGWSGQWNARAEADKARLFRLDAGMEDCNFLLYPGERVRSPRVLVLPWSGCERDSYNAFRRLMREIGQKKDGKAVVPPVSFAVARYGLQPSSDMWHIHNMLTTESIIENFDAVKGCGFENLWLDAWWHEGGFPKGIGNYGIPVERAVDKKRYPNGLKEISDYAHANGATFLLWYEPERAAEGTLLAKERPEWMVSAGGEPQEYSEPGYMVNLGIPEACDFMTRVLKESVDAFGVDILRIDFNYSPLNYWRKNDMQNGGESRRGISEIRYVEGLYRMWDALLETYPHLRIDNCAGGGLRIDLETSTRSYPLYRTDALALAGDSEQVAVQNQLMTLGLNRYIPYSPGNIGDISLYDGDELSPYVIRSCFNGGIMLAGNCQAPGYPIEELKAAIAECKRLRPYYSGDFYPLTPESGVSRESWCAMQYHLPGEDKGLVTAFRREGSPYSEFVRDLYAIDENAEYRVSVSEAFQKEPARIMAGIVLKRVVLRLDSPRSSLVLEYERV